MGAPCKIQIDVSEREPEPTSERWAPTGLRSLPFALAAIGYTTGIVAAEACVAFVRPDVGVVSHALILFALLQHYLWTTRRPSVLGETGRATASRDVLVALALVPLLRISSLTMPLPEMSQLRSYTAAGAPVLVATLLAARALPSSDLRGRLLRYSGQHLIALSGIPLGLFAYAIVRPEPLDAGVLDIVLGSAGLVAFSAAAEELLFRGVLQNALCAAFGPVGILGSTGLFAAVYLGVRPLGYAAFAAAVGLLFAWFAHRTRSLLGVVVAHALLTVSAIVIWPLLIG